MRISNLGNTVESNTHATPLAAELSSPSLQHIYKPVTISIDRLRTMSKLLSGERHTQVFALFTKNASLSGDEAYFQHTFVTVSTLA